MKASGLHFIRGSKVFDFNMRMMVQVMGQIFIWAVIGFAFLVFSLLYITSAKEIHLISIHALSHLLAMIGKGSKVVWHSKDYALTADMLIHSKSIMKAVDLAKLMVWIRLKSVVLIGGLIYFFIVWLF